MFAVVTFHDTGPCSEFPSVTCPMHTFGPFDTFEEGERFMLSLIPGQAPHLVHVRDPIEAYEEGFAVSRPK